MTRKARGGWLRRYARRVRKRLQECHKQAWLQASATD